MRLINFIEAPLSFIFLGTKGKARYATAALLAEFNAPPLDSTHHPYPDNIVRLVYSMKVYEAQIKRGLGLGFLSSFIPGTTSFKARMNYLRAAMALDEHILVRVDANKHHFNVFDRLLLKSATSPLHFLAKFLEEYSGILISVKKRTLRDKSFEALTDYYLRRIIFDEVEASQIAFNVIHTLGNPVRILSALLDFLNHCVYALLGSPSVLENPSSSPFQVMLDRHAATFFLCVRLPVATLEAAVDSFWKAIAAITFRPIIFLYQATQQTLHYRGKEFIVTDTDTLRAVKVIRKINKANQQSSIASYEGELNEEEVEVNKPIYSQTFSKIYCAMSKPMDHTTEYMTMQKNGVYQKGRPLDHQVMLAATSKKARELEIYTNFYIRNKHRFTKVKDDQTINAPMSDGHSLLDIINSEFCRASKI